VEFIGSQLSCGELSKQAIHPVLSVINEKINVSDLNTVDIITSIVERNTVERNTPKKNSSRD
jgi:hypothetical protein